MITLSSTRQKCLSCGGCIPIIYALVGSFDFSFLFSSSRMEENAGFSSAVVVFVFFRVVQVSLQYNDNTGLMTEVHCFSSFFLTSARE